MGILRKLAELVVEFPEAQKPAAENGDHDVLASIEQIRQDLETDMAQGRPDFTEPTPAKGSAQAAKPSASVGAVATGQSSGSARLAANSDIRVPSILNVTEVYGKANLQPSADSLDIYRVEKMLADPEIADLPLETRARSVRMALRSMGKELPELIADAARRDQALEAYEQFLHESLGEVSRHVSEVNAKLQQEVDEFVRVKTAQIEANKAALAQAHSGIAQFLAAKKAEEQRLFNIVAPFVAPGQNPVQVSGAAPPASKGEK